MEPNSTAKVPVQSVQRCFDILDHLAEAGVRGEAVGLQAVAERLGVASTTAHNLLKSMTICGYVARDEGQGYRLGPKCRDLVRGSRFLEGMLESAAPVLHALAERTGESVVLATLLHGRRHPLLRVEGQGLVRVTPAFEELGRFYELVTGRVLAAWAGAEELAAIRAAHGLPGPAWNGLADDAALGEALAELRERGYAEAETAGEVVALAVPVLDGRGRLLAALGLFLPAFRADPARRAELLDDMLEAAGRLAAG